MTGTALVTGVSSGIGRAIAERLLGDGWQVVGVSRRRPDLLGCRWIEADLADPGAAAEVAARAGRLDAVVHAAGLQFSAPLGKLEHDQGALMWRLHVDVPTRLLDALVDGLPDGARVVLIGSRTSAGVAGKSQYAATKSALLGLARSWALELAPRRITVNVVAPGPTATPMLADPARAATPPRLPALGRFVEPSEVAALTALLVGAEGGSITGQQLVICGESVAVTPRLVGLVADDLTGATDSAVQFAAGWPAHLLRSPGAGSRVAESGPALLAIVTGVRAAADEVAAERTAEAVRELLAHGCDRLYVKIDSTMRGSVAGQLRGALAAWAERHTGAGAVLCPAFPDQGRTVAGGQVLVEGVPVARTAAAADPVTPVVDSRLERLVPGAAATTLTDLGHLPVLRHEFPVVFVDAATNGDLIAVAESVDQLGPRWAAAGSAGLATALARQWSGGGSATVAASRPSARILVGISSLHPIALRSVQRLRDAMATAGTAEQPAVDVITTPTARADAAMIAADFGERVAEQLSRAPYDALVLVGGDGAAATLDRVGATAVTVQSALAPGVPLGTIVGGTAHGVRVVTKSGGFGDSDSLVYIIDRLQAGAQPRKETS